MATPSYRERLRIEGLALAGSGAAGTLILLLAVPESRTNEWSTIGQIAFVALLLGVLGPISVRRAMDGAQPVAAAQAGSGEPTPVWQLPAICAVLALSFGFGAGWDAGLRITLGCVLVGLAQAVLLERMVAARERRDGGRFVRVPGSRLFLGTRLGRVS